MIYPEKAQEVAEIEKQKKCKEELKR